MDLLSQYKQEHPEFQEKKQAPMTDEYGRVYTGMIALVMRLSGGRVRDARTAGIILLIAGGIIFAVSLVIFFSAPGGASKPTGESLPRFDAYGNVSSP